MQVFVGDPFESNAPIMYWVSSILWDIISASMNCSILIIHHKYGLKMLKIFMEHSTIKFTNFKRVKIIWTLHLLILVLVFVVQSIIFAESFYYIMFSFINNNLMLMPLYYSISFISWIVSINFTKNIKIVKEYLNENVSFMKCNHLHEANNFAMMNYKKMNKIDNYLSSGFIISAIEVVSSIMLTVYFTFYAGKFDYLIISIN